MLGGKRSRDDDAPPPPAPTGGVLTSSSSVSRIEFLPAGGQRRRSRRGGFEEDVEAAPIGSWGRPVEPLPQSVQRLKPNEDTPWEEIDGSRPFRIFYHTGFELARANRRERAVQGDVLTSVRHTKPPWYTCADPEANEEHPIFVPWITAVPEVPPMRTLIQQRMKELREQMASKRPQQQQQQEPGSSGQEQAPVPDSELPALESPQSIPLLDNESFTAYNLALMDSPTVSHFPSFPT